MKRYIRNSEDFNPADIKIGKIVSIVLVDDVNAVNPRDYAVMPSNEPKDEMPCTCNVLKRKNENNLI